MHQHALRSFEPHNFHDFNFHAGYLFHLRIIGKVDSSTFQTSIALLASISKRYVISIHHYRIEHPTIGLSLDVTHHCSHLEMIELLIPLEKLLYLRLQGRFRNLL